MSSAELAGCFVDPTLFCKLVLPHLKSSAGSSTTASSSCLMILAALLRGCNPELIKPHLKVWSPWKLYLSANHSDKFLFELWIHWPLILFMVLSWICVELTIIFLGTWHVNVSIIKVWTLMSEWSLIYNYMKGSFWFSSCY